jgi:hypothetical protein
VLGTGTCVALIAVGAILRFALSAGSPHGLNVHVVGVIVIERRARPAAIAAGVGPAKPGQAPPGRLGGSGAAVGRR